MQRRESACFKSIFFNFSALGEYCASGFFSCPNVVCHCVAAVHPITEEVPFPVEFGVDRFENLEFRDLAGVLSAVLVQDRAATTVTTYLRAYKSWKTWAEQHNASYLPVDSVVFILYIISLIQQTRSVSSMNSAVYGGAGFIRVVITGLVSIPW